MARVAVGDNRLHLRLLLQLFLAHGCRPSLMPNLAARRWCRVPAGQVEARARDWKAAEVDIARAACGRGRNGCYRRRLGSKAAIAHTGPRLRGVLAHAVVVWLSAFAGHGGRHHGLLVCCGGDKVEASHRRRWRPRISSGGLDATGYSRSVGDLGRGAAVARVQTVGIARAR